MRELLRHPEQLVQHPGHMQQLIGMVDAAKRLLTVSPGDAAAAAAAATAVAAPAPSAFTLQLPAAALPAAGADKKKAAPRKRKGEWRSVLPLDCVTA